MVTGIQDHFLGAPNRQRRLGGNACGDLLHPGIQRFPAVKHPVDQANALRLIGQAFAPGIGQLACDAVAHQLGQALQGAHVGRHTNVDLLDGEAGVCAAVTHVGTGHQINAATNTGAVDGGQHRLAAALQAGEGVLHVQNDAAQRLAGAGIAVVLDLRAQAHHHLQVDAGTEQFSFTLQNCHAGLWLRVHPLKGFADFLPHGGVHRVGFFGAVQTHRGDVVFQCDGQGFIFHDDSRFIYFWPAAPANQA